MRRAGTIDEATAAGKGFRRRISAATWQGGSSRASATRCSLDVPSTALSEREGHEGGGARGADGKPKVPASRDRARHHGEEDRRGDTFGFAIAPAIRALHLGLPQPLWQNGPHLPPTSRGGVSSRGARVAEFGRARRSARHCAARERQLSRGVHRRSARHVIAGSWNFTGCAPRKVELRGGAGAAVFKQPVVWSMAPVRLPKPKSADRNRRAGVDARAVETDHVAEWTLKAGRSAAARPTGSRVTGDPVLKTLLGQARTGRSSATPKWSRPRTSPTGSKHLHRTEAREARWRPGRQDQRAAGLSVTRRRRPTNGRRIVSCAGSAAVGLPRLPAAGRCACSSPTPVGARVSFVGLANYTRLAKTRAPREPLEHGVLHGGRRCDPRRPAGPGLALNRRRVTPTSLRACSSSRHALGGDVGLACSGCSIPSSARSTNYLPRSRPRAHGWRSGDRQWAIIATTVWWVTGYYLVIYSRIARLPASCTRRPRWTRRGCARSARSRPAVRPVLLLSSSPMSSVRSDLARSSPQHGGGDATRTVVQHLYETRPEFFQFGRLRIWCCSIIMVFSILSSGSCRAHDTEEMGATLQRSSDARLSALASVWLLRSCGSS